MIVMMMIVMMMIVMMMVVIVMEYLRCQLQRLLGVRGDRSGLGLDSGDI